MPSLLEKAYINQKIPFDKFAIFELNKVYQKDFGLNEEKVPVEKMQMGFVVAERKNKGTQINPSDSFITIFDKQSIREDSEMIIEKVQESIIAQKKSKRKYT